ncbi:hypothetical protein K469DRAFT_742615 [Zopfia rhizophila CBS 207.26]|uniref:Uncharacterized protein n=1 Tax=Zopfia rhizophila CBS 207.26 TaxID=1314779 RepID=A0A6A6DGT4_9PEZI|nr:hypothetical protein K469DRAFT_742615 [Zopfia rhizophila CBS 207.26]
MSEDALIADLDEIRVLTEFLNCHQCPSVIVDHGAPSNGISNRPSLVYTNSSFASWVRRIPASSLSSEVEEDFRQWVIDPTTWAITGGSKTGTILYEGISWTIHLIRERWRVLQSSMPNNSHLTSDDGRFGSPRKRLRPWRSEESPPSSNCTLTSTQGLSNYLPSPGTSAEPGGELSRCIVDWTRLDIPLAPDVPEYITFLRSFDWSPTVVGPMEGWSNALRRHMYFMNNNPDPRAIFWGNDDPAMLYNEACSRLMGKAHPAALGVSGAVGCGASWDYKRRGIKEVMATGKPVQHFDHYHPIVRGKLGLVESYWSWNILPIMDDNGCIVGTLKEFTESTARVVNERRAKTTSKAEQMSPAETIGMFWAQVREIFDSNSQDFPFCLMYSIPNDSQPEKLGDSSVEDTIPKSFALEGSVGLNKDHPLVIDELDITDVEYPLTKQFRIAWISRKPVLLRASDGTLPDCLAMSIPSRGLGAVCKSAVLCPISRLDGPGAIGCLILGLNPLRPYNDDYRGFIKSLIDHLVRAAASILVPEGQRNLLERTKKAKDQERTFARLAELAPIGLAIFNPLGIPIWRNHAYDSLLNLRKDESYPPGVRAPIHPEDRPRTEKLFGRLLNSPGPDSETFQFRVRINSSTGADGSEEWRWLLVTASSEVDDHGEVVRVTNFVTDISRDKENEALQAQKLEDALETKRQSENFIDMTSHEMRNPLSAIIQSADGILAAFDPNTPGNDGIAPSRQGPISTTTQATVIESARTILLCAQHQKRIVDDIVTLSKLDSNLLLISPDCVRPVALVEKALQMYEAELRDADIIASFSVEQSYQELDIRYVLLDPSRLLQVLINLITNAIKLTRSSDSKRISILLGASLTPPSCGPGTVSFIPQRASRVDGTSSGEWGTGQEVFLRFDVSDTGKGLTTEEMKLLFLKFSQASPKTYSQYGGSGLGLFISRELTELQGGQIGVHSVAEKGSTFTFYIKARKYEPGSLYGNFPAEISCREATPEGKTAKDSLPASLAYTDAASPDDSHGPDFAKPVSVNLPADLHILLVEDNLINQKVTAQRLRQIGCTVHVANHGLECLDFLKTSCYYRGPPKLTTNLNAHGIRPIISSRSQSAPDTATHSIPLSVILLDQEMPYMDGLSCVTRIREMQGTGELLGHVPVITVTANARREQIDKAIEAGMDEVVTKPFRIPDLLPKMFELVRRVKTSPPDPRPLDIRNLDAGLMNGVSSKGVDVRKVE